MALSTTSLTGLAAQLKKPFEMVEAGQVDEIGIYVYISHGRFGWHRHVDEDELFLVLNGLVSLESEWGSLTLHAGEMSLMPKGIGHRSASLWRSTVILMRPKARADAQNGHRRLHGLPGDDFITKTNLHRLAADAPPEFSLKPILELGAYRLYLQRGVGISPWLDSAGASRLLLMHDGNLSVETADDSITLSESDITILPPGTRYRLLTSRSCTLLHLTHAAPPDNP